MVEELLLPAGTRLLHIGPHKTGTTALQHALHSARDELARHGVVRLGTRRHEAAAVAGFVGHPLPHVAPARSTATWNAIVAEAARYDSERAVLSSEYFSDASGSVVPKVIDAFGPQTHVAVTLRPLASILPSQWQQYVVRGLRLRYDRWLAQILDPDAVETGVTRRTTSFWLRHRHDRLVARWAEAVGADNVTVVVLDPDDRAFLARSFESLLGLAETTLDGRDGVGNRQNRSLTAAEAELLRLYNKGLAARGYDRADHVRVVRGGMAGAIKSRVPGPDETPIVTPQWARERAAEIGAQMADAIACSGVRVVGDLGHLSHVGEALPADVDLRVTPQVAAAFALGIDAGWAALLESQRSRAAQAAVPSKPGLRRRARRRVARVFGRRRR